MLRKRPMKERTWRPQVGPAPASPTRLTPTPHVCACPLFGAIGFSRRWVCSNARGLLTASPAEAAASARDPGQHTSNVPQTGASVLHVAPAFTRTGNKATALGRVHAHGIRPVPPTTRFCPQRTGWWGQGVAVSSHESAAVSETLSTGSQAVALPRDRTFSVILPATKNSNCQN